MVMARVTGSARVTGMADTEAKAEAASFPPRVALFVFFGVDRMSIAACVPFGLSVLHRMLIPVGP